MVLDFFVPAKWIYFVLAVIVGLAAFAAYLYLYGHSKERFATSTEKIKVKDMMKAVAKNKPMVLALLMSMLASPRYMIMSVAIYISIYVVTIPGLESGTVLVLLYIVVGAGMFAGILLTPPTYKKFGYKKASLLYGAIGAVFLGGGFGVGLVNIYAALPFMTIGGLGLGAYNTLPYPMVGDSLDYLEWKTGERMEGICFSWNSFVTKFNNAVGALGVIVGLMVIGYVQPEVSGEYLPQTQFVKDGMFALADPHPRDRLRALPSSPCSFTTTRASARKRSLPSWRKNALRARRSFPPRATPRKRRSPALTESVFVKESAVQTATTPHETESGDTPEQGE